MDIKQVTDLTLQGASFIAIIVLWRRIVKLEDTILEMKAAVIAAKVLVDSKQTLL